MADLQEPVSIALDQLGAETARAAQPRRCLTSATFWKVALGVDALTGRDATHLRDCAVCRRRAEEVAAAAQTRSPAAHAKPGSYLSEQPLQPSRARTRDGYPGPQHLRFADDADLAFHVRRERDGVWLQVEHPHWPAGTLVRLTIGAADQKGSWSVFLLLRSGCARHRLNKPLLLDQEPLLVCIERVTVASLRASDAPRLREACRLAARDDPMAPWATWAQEAVKAGKLPAALRAVLLELGRSIAGPPPTGAR